MTINKIYIVFGCDGEYSDRIEWNVAAYPDEESARQHAKKAKEWNDHLWYKNFGKKQSQQNNSNPWDPEQFKQYEDTDYGVTEIELYPDVSYFMLSQKQRDEKVGDHE